jgi:predicted transcriptional regulator
MSTKFARPSLLDNVKAAEKLGKAAFKVYRTLERMAVAHGNGFRAKHATIAEQAGLSISTVQRALIELGESQMVRIRANARTISGRNYRISNSYFIMQAAVWCFTSQLKRLAKLFHKAVDKPVSVKVDRAIKTNVLSPYEMALLHRKYAPNSNHERGFCAYDENKFFRNAN